MLLGRRLVFCTASAQRTGNSAHSQELGVQAGPSHAHGRCQVSLQLLSGDCIQCAAKASMFDVFALFQGSTWIKRKFALHRTFGCAPERLNFIAIAERRIPRLGTVRRLDTKPTQHARSYAVGKKAAQLATANMTPCIACNAEDRHHALSKKGEWREYSCKIAGQIWNKPRPRR
jgi:hypothetical protein